ncbi:MAG TPA: FG-GAP-like repeat-containing protein [Terracidiphilus sp.]|nr:FG-GAP-like repeat-containing protein [Terracidiphilus sp.]
MPARTLAVFLLLVSSTLTAAAQGVFQVEQTFPVYQPPAGCGSNCSYMPVGAGLSGAGVSGDFNGDNKLDFAYILEPYNANQTPVPPDYLVVVFGQSSGAPQQVGTLLTQCTPRLMAAADVNQDKKLDLVVFCHEGFLEAFLGNGDGTFQAPVRSPMSLNPSLVTAMTLADFNGDGLPDLAIAVESGYAISLNQNNGQFAVPVTQSPGVYDIAAADVNGDGIQDLVFGSGYVLGNGNGTFQPEQPLPSGVGYFALGDFNNDGYSDLAYVQEDILPGNDPTGSLYWIKGSSSGLTSSPVAISGDGFHVGALNAIPLGSNSTPDLLSTVNSLGAVDGFEVSSLNNSGSFNPPVGWAYAPDNGFVVADVNGDGIPDIVAIDFGVGDSEFTFVAGTGGGNFNTGPFTVASNTGAATADMNGDGLPDAIIKNAVFAGAPQVYLSTGDGRFTAAPTATGGSTDSGYLVVAADFNGDSHTDVVSIDPGIAGCAEICGPGTAQVFSYRGNGDGTLTFLNTFTLPHATITGAVSGDFNGDGKQDLVFTYSVPGTEAGLGEGGAFFLPGNGDGTFGTPSDIALLEIDPTAVVAADLNGDGKLDLVISDGSGTVISYLGNGNGTFSAMTQFLSIYASSIAVADVTGDVIPDLVCATPNDIQVYAGAGNGTFSAAPVYTSPQNLSGPVQIGDVNGDGLPDIAVLDGSPILLLNQGSGNFTSDSNRYVQLPSDATGFFLTKINHNEIASGSKQYLDLLVSSTSGLSSLLNQNNPAPTLQATTTSLSAGPLSAPVGTPITLTATVSPATATGTVKFQDGTTALGAGTLTEGVATLSVSDLSAGSHSITASYSGDALNAPSTSTAISLTVAAATLQIFANPSSISIAQGGSGSATITVTPVGAYNGTITFACSGLPANSACAFSPASLVFTSSSQAAQQTTVTISTNVAVPQALLSVGGQPVRYLALAAVFLVAFRRRRGLCKNLIAVVLATCTLMLWGCGGGGSGKTTSNPTTPIGVSTVTIMVAGSATSTSLTVDITP